MGTPAGDPRSEPRLLHTLRGDVGHVFEDVRTRGFRREIHGTLVELEAFYLSEAARARLARMSLIPRYLHRAWWLIKSLLMRLTPARRVMLALGLFLMIFRVAYASESFTIEFRGLGNALVVLVLMLELKDKLLARDELKAGRAVQLALLPQNRPAVPGWDVWLYTEPANDVGGDLVDHLQIDDRRHAIALGDVAGKALPAALLMVKLQATLRALIPQFDSLSDLGAGVNRIIERDGLANRFATLVYLVVSADDGHVRLLNAGHPPPLAVRSGAVEELPPGSIALGIMPGATFVEQRVALRPGDTLVVYSDGVTEASNEAGDFFGDARLHDAVSRAAARDAAAIGTSVLDALKAFVGQAPPHDDVSLVIVQRTSLPPG